MKTAISIPDDVFLAAGKQAKRARKSRSQLYAEAMAEYLSRHAPDDVTEQMNQALEQIGEPLSSFAKRAALKIFEQFEW